MLHRSKFGHLCRQLTAGTAELVYGAATDVPTAFDGCPHGRWNSGRNQPARSFLNEPGVSNNIMDTYEWISNTISLCCQDVTRFLLRAERILCLKSMSHPLLLSVVWLLFLAVNSRKG